MHVVNYLLTLALLLFILGIGIIIGPIILRKLGDKEPEVQRRWTDPSQHD